MSNPEKRRALVIGAGGFVGAELLRLIATHPNLTLTAALSGTHAGKRIGEIHPNLAAATEASFIAPEHFEWDRIRDGKWSLFCALAHGETMKEMPRILKAMEGTNANLVDLSGDFRLKESTEYETYYGKRHEAIALLPSFTYGPTELMREKISAAKLIANPGCLATGAQLALLPLANAKLPIRFIAIDGKTGSSGAGIKPKETTHHPNRMNNFKAYLPLTHQHFPEIAMGWKTAGGNPETEISFVPQMAPMVRGIFTTAHIFLEQELSQAEITDRYAEFFKSSPFVRIVEGSPSVQGVWGTNFCDLSIAAEGKRVVICGAIDNLLKGASGQAIQNMNIMNGWEETAGLLSPPPMPI